MEVSSDEASAEAAGLVVVSGADEVFAEAVGYAVLFGTVEAFAEAVGLAAVSGAAKAVAAVTESDVDAANFPQAVSDKVISRHSSGYSGP